MTVCEQDYSLLCSGEIDMKDEGLYYHEFDDEIYDEKNLLRLKDGYTVLDMIKESKKANSNWFYINKIFTDPTTGKLYHGITIIEDPICKPVEEYREVGRFSQVRPKGFDSKLAHRVLVDLQENGFKFDEDRMIVVVTIGEDGYYHYEIFEGHHRQYNYDTENVSHMVATGIMIDEVVIAEHYGDVEDFIWILKTKLNRDLVNLTIVKSEDLNIVELYRFINYLDSNDLDSSPYRMVFHSRIASLLAIPIMCLFALPFSLGLLR